MYVCVILTQHHLSGLPLPVCVHVHVYTYVYICVYVLATTTLYLSLLCKVVKLPF
jgi:hypothetical protein